MNTTMQHDMGNHRHGHGFVARTLLLLLLFLAGEMGSEVWATQYTYYLVNRSNKIMFSYTQDVSDISTAPELALQLQSPFAHNYHYYDTQEAAYSNSGTGLSSYADATGTDIYVGYDFDSSQGVKLDGSEKYILKFNDKWYLLLNGSSTALRAQDVDIIIDKYEWTLYNENNDPYDITIRNADLDGYFLTFNKELNGDADVFFELDANPDGKTLKTFAYLKTKDGKMRMVAFSDYSTDANRNKYEYFKFDNQWANCAAINTTNMNGGNADILKPVTYHLISNPSTGSREVFWSKRGQHAGDALSLPNALKSTLLQDDDYIFYTSLDDAKNDRTANAVSTLAEGISDIYVRYVYDKSTADVKLDGSINYSLLQGTDATKNAYLKGTTGGSRPNEAFSGEDDMLWYFVGEDPYVITIRNVKFGDSYFMAIGDGDDPPTGWTNSKMYNTAKAMGTFSMLANNRLVAIKNSGSVQQFSYFGNSTGAEGANWFNGSTIISDYSQSGWGSAQSWIIKNPHSVTLTKQVSKVSVNYKVVSIEKGSQGGEVKLTTSSTGYTGDPLDLPEAYKSPLATNFKYYTEDQFTVSADGKHFTLKPGATPSTEYPSTSDVTYYVKYDYDPANAESISLSGNVAYTMQHNWPGNIGWYIYNKQQKDGSAYQVEHAGELPTDNNEGYYWLLAGEDPYAITITSVALPNYHLARNSSTDGDARSRLYPDGNDLGLPDTWIYLKKHRLITCPNDDGSHCFFYGNFFNRSAKLDNIGTDAEVVLTATPRKAYTFHIIDRSGHEAVKADGEWHVGVSLTNDAIPASIRSPFLDGETFTVYKTATANASKTSAQTGDSRTIYDLSNLSNGAPADATDIYVTYSYTPASHPIDLTGDMAYYIKIGDDYITNVDHNTGDTQPNETFRTFPSALLPHYSSHMATQYRFKGGDPYNITVTNVCTEYDSDERRGKIKGILRAGTGSDYFSVTESDNNRPISSFMLVGSGIRQLKLAASYSSAIYFATKPDVIGQRVMLMTADAAKVQQIELQAVTTYHIYTLDKKEAVTYEGPSVLAADNTKWTVNIPAGVKSPLVEASGGSFAYHAAASSLATDITEIDNRAKDVYVTYTYDNASSPIDLSSTSAKYSITDNGYYVFAYGGDVDMRKDNESPNDDNYLWYFQGGDPYAMLIKSHLTGKRWGTTSLNGNKLWLYTDAQSPAIGSFFLVERPTSSSDWSHESGYYNLVSAVNTTESYRTKLSTVYYGEYEDDPNAYRGRVNAYIAPYNEAKRISITTNSIANYHLINFNGQEVITYQQRTSDGTAVPEAYRSRLAGAYTCYAADQVTIDGDGRVTLNAGATPLADVPASDAEVYVFYEGAPATGAALDLSGATPYIVYSYQHKLMGNAAEAQVNYTAATSVPKLSNYKWVLEATVKNGRYDPYDVKMKNTGRDQYLNAKKPATIDASKSETHAAWANSDDDISHMMLLNGIADDGYELSPCLFPSSQALAYLFDEGGYEQVKTYRSATTGHGHTSIQFSFRPVSAITNFHVVDLSGQTAVSTPDVAYHANRSEAITLPSAIASPLIKDGGYRYYGAVTGSEGSYTPSGSPLSTWADITGSDVYVFYDASSVDTETFDLMGGMTYNLRVLSVNNDTKNYSGAIVSFHTQKEGFRTAYADAGGLGDEARKDFAHLYRFVCADGKADPYAIRIQPYTWDNLYVGATSLTHKTKLNAYADDADIMTVAIVPGRAEGKYQFMVTGREDDGILMYFGNEKDIGICLLHSADVKYHNNDNSIGLIQWLITSQPLDYQYVVIDLKGEEAVASTVMTSETQKAGEAPLLPVDLQSPLVPLANYSYWADRACTTPLTVLPAAPAVVYVTYTYDDAASPIHLNGTAAYNWFLKNRRRNDSGSEEVPVYVTNAFGLKNTSELDESTLSGNDNYLFVLNSDVSGGDPYRVFVSKQGDPTRYLGHSNPFQGGIKTIGWSAAETAVNASGYKLALLRSGSDDAVALTLAWRHTDVKYNAAHVINERGVLRFWWNLGENGSGHWHVKYNTPFVETRLERNGLFTYTVVNTAGNEALSRYVGQVRRSATGDHTPLAVPDVLKSPLVHGDRFRLFATQGDAANYTADPTNTTFAAKAITELWQAQEKTVYVGYDYTVPAIDLKIDGTTWYHVFTKADRHFLHADAGGTGIEATPQADGTDPDDDDDSYQWRLSGGDPYRLIVTNRLTGGTVQGTTDGATTATLSPTLGTPASQYEFVVLGDAVKGYCLVLTNPSRTGGSDDRYLYTLGRSDGTPSVGLLQGNDDATAYTTDEPRLRLWFKPFTRIKLTYKIVDTTDRTTVVDEQSVWGNAGETAARNFPASLSRIGAVITGYSLTPNPYIAGTLDLAMGTESADVYVAYEVDDTQLPFHYSTATAAYPQQMYWYNWKTYDTAWHYQTYDTATGSIADETTVTPDDTASETLFADDHIFAFLGDPYRTTIISKETGKDVYLATEKNLLKTYVDAGIDDLTGAFVPIGPVYKIVNMADEVAVVSQPVRTLTTVMPPAAVVSPALSTEGLTYSYSPSRATAVTGKKLLEQHVPYSYEPVYVFYTTANVQRTGTPPLRMTNTKKYNVLVAADQFLRNSSGTATVESSDEYNEMADDWMWRLDARVGDAADPYHLVLRNVADDAMTVQTYVLMSGSDNSHWHLQTLSDTNDGSTATPYTYLDTSLGESTTAAEVELRGIPLRVTYNIVNRRNMVATHSTVRTECGDQPEVPAVIKSPLVEQSGGRYTFHYSEDDAANDIVGTTTVEQKSESNYKGIKVTRMGTAYADDYEFEYDLEGMDVTIYVDYTYNNAKSPLDLSGRSHYNVFSGDSAKVFIGSNSGGPFTEPVAEGKGADYQQKYDYSWRLECVDENLPDPYDVLLYSCYREKYITDDNDRGKTGIHTTNPSTTDLGDSYATMWWRKDGNWRMAIVEGDKAGQYRLQSVALGATGFAYDFPNGTFGNDDHYYYLTTAKTTDNKIYVSSDSQTDRNFNLKFTPIDVVSVVYHIRHKITGQEQVYGPVDHVAQSRIDLPEVLQRKFCDYTYHCRYSESGETVGTDNDARNEAADGSGSDYSIAYYPRVLADGEQDNAMVDIFVGYNTRWHDDGAADQTNRMPFDLLANDQAGVDNLMAGLTADGSQPLSDILDFSTYEKRRDNARYVHFLVQGVNNNWTSGAQRFLRLNDITRYNSNTLKDDVVGTQVGYLDDDYALHRVNEYNVNEWPYSRCAETYREGENAPFQEKRWLWAFAGDPYDLYIYNVHALTEEQFNLTTQSVSERTYHLLNLMGCTEERIVNADSTVTTRLIPSAPVYSKATDSRAAVTAWGMGMEGGTASDRTFSLVLPYTDDDGTERLRYWRMNGKRVLAETRPQGTSSLDYNMQVLPYEPLKYEDLRFMVRRDDHVAEYKEWLDEAPTAPKKDGEGKTTMMAKSHLESQTSGTIRLFGADSDRAYVIGDRITALPTELLRQFCDYTLYTDDYFTALSNDAVYTVVRSPLKGRQQHYGDAERGGDSDPSLTRNPFAKKGEPVYTDDGMPIHYYYAVDDDGNAVLDSLGNQIMVMPQTVYVKYRVTSDIFLKQAPTKAQVAEMLEHNDHVYFMDFPTGTQTTHHAFFDQEATFRIQTGDLKEKRDKNTGVWKTEKKRNAGGDTFVDDTENPYNRCEFRTVNNRMVSVPDHLKWYFVGDPYRVQVYNTSGAWNTETLKGQDGNILTQADGKTPLYPAGTKAANLARFNPIETNFQFVVDCVHLQVPDYQYIDSRKTVVPTDILGQALDPVDNSHYMHPYYNDFYWEVVPSTSGDDQDFALRFRENNELLGYRNVYYYLAHDGLTKQYRTDGNNETYRINLNYTPVNKFITEGTYKGYHTVNNENTTVRLVQPVKVFVSAFGAVDEGTQRSENAKGAYPSATSLATELTDKRKTEWELSEYYGLGERLTEVPRHLQRKFVSYGAMDYDLTIGNETQSKECTVSTPTDPEHPGSYAHLDGEGNPLKTYKDVEFRFDVSYALDDVTRDGIHLFTPATTNLATTAPQWVDMSVSDGHWLYFDKVPATTTPVDSTAVSDYRRAMSGDKKGWNGSVDGWKDGLKGLHWGLIGDPYDFTMVNRRRYEDGSNSGAQWLTVVNEDDSDETNDYVRLTDGQANAVHLAARYWRSGGADDVVLTNAGGSKRMVAQYNADGQFRMLTPEPLDRRRYTDNEGALSYDAYVNQGYSYNKDLNGLGGMQQLLKIGTVVARDRDRADNDCFDTEVRVYTTQGVLRLSRKGMEIKYDKATEALPYALRRYGCDYTCWLVTTDSEGHTVDSLMVSDFDSDEPLMTTKDSRVNGKTFRQFITAHEQDATPVYRLSYTYTVNEDVGQYFTTASDALTDDYTWMNTYFAWNQTYSGTNVEVEYYEHVFDHYVYNAQGQIIDEVWVWERKTKTEPNPSQSYPTTAYLNAHTGQPTIFADESTQSESDRQKWALVGDPYAFTMSNYAQYLDDDRSTLTLNGQTVENSTIASQAKTFAITVGKDGKSYLTLIDDRGEAITSITFDFGGTSDRHLKTKGTGTNTKDPTGNSLDTGDVKPFMMTNLLRYADLVQYHLVIAHQHSLDPEDTYLDLSKADDDATVMAALGDDSQKKAARSTLKEHLLEWLMYRGIGRNEPTMYVNYKDNKPETLTPVSYKDDMKDNIKTLLKQNASLRDFISYPIDDYSVSRVGIGNRPQVPWYMKRQFCRYFLYQKDVLHSQTDTSSPALVPAGDDWTGLTVVIGGTSYRRDPDSQYTVTMKGDDGVTYNDVVQRTFTEKDANGNDVVKRAYNVKWVSIFDTSEWPLWTDADTKEANTDPVTADRKVTIDGTDYKAPKYYTQAKAQQGKVLDKLQDCHFNRKVLIDVVYEVIPEAFKFSDRGRNTTAWYQLMTNNEADGLMNFTYREGIGARMDRTEHYTNNYLWAPEGDPYGFVLHSRYATINGTGWDDVVMTTTGVLPTKDGSAAEDDYSDSELAAGKFSKYQATYTSKTKADDNARFVSKRIIHLAKGQKRTDGTTVATNGAVNAIYEMFTGDAGFTNSFLMHPTSAYIDTEDKAFTSYYICHNTGNLNTYLQPRSGRELQTNADANWTLNASAHQLLPYFERSGYVGGMRAELMAADFTYQDYYERLKDAVKGVGEPLDFTTLRKIQEVVYEGTFKDNTGKQVNEVDDRPDGSLLPMTFESQNLVNMTAGYYRIRAFSQKPLDIDGNDLKGDGKKEVKGVTGPRYISGYRFESEKVDNPSTTAVRVGDKDYNPSTLGGRWLHFLETDMNNSDLHTYADLKGKIAAAGGGTDHDRDVFDHVAMRGNIEILPADFDPSSIFYFEQVPTEQNEGQPFVRYQLSTQGLQLRMRPGGTQVQAGVIDDNCGHTELVNAGDALRTGYDYRMRLADIGGTAVTLRTMKELVGGTKDWDDVVDKNLRTNYLCIDRHHRYRITCHEDNEMVEIGDHSDNHGTYGIQDTKWLLQPVGIREEWPYNEMPLRVEVQQGGVRNHTLTEPDLSSEGNKDKYYYGSLYVPFDTRLGNTTDAAFTLTSEPTSVGTVDTPGKVTMSSVSRLNEMGNPQFVPANWPVVLRTNNDKNVVELKNQKVNDETPATTYVKRHYVNMYIPNNKPTVIKDAVDGEKRIIRLNGSYLEQNLDDLPAEKKTALFGTDDLTRKTIMVFGLPFEGGASHSSHEYDKLKQVGWFSNHNWMRGYGEGSIVGGTGDQPTTNNGSAAAAFLADARSATDAQRNNLYVYHNKAYYVYTEPASPVRYSIVVFDDDLSGDPDNDPDIDVISDDVPWPCAVYDLQGRRVAERETPATLRHNHPALPRGVYIFGTRKVVVR